MEQLPAGDGYRSSSGRHKFRISDPKLLETVKSRKGKIVANYGAFTIVEVDTETAEELKGNTQAEWRDDYNLILLNAGSLDTTSDDAVKLRQAASAAQFRGRQLHLVQFPGPVKPEWYTSLLNTGVEIISYIPNNAYLVYGDASALRRVKRAARSDAFLQWDAPYSEELKIDPVTNEFLRKEKDSAKATQGISKRGAPDAARSSVQESGLFAIQMVKDKESNAATLDLIDKHKIEPIVNQYEILKYINVIVRIAPEDTKSIAARPDVVSIQPYVMPTLRDERQNTIIAGNLTGNAPTPGDYLAYLASHGFTQAQFTMSGFSVDVGDDGLDNATTMPNHPHLYVMGSTSNPSRVVYARKEGAGSGPEIRGCDGHGTLNTHIVGGYVPFAFGSGFPHADLDGFRHGMGVCPFVRVGSSVVFSPGFTSPNFADWQSRAYNDGSRISTNSWGASTAGAYTVDSQAFDALVRDAQPAAAAIPAMGNQEMVIVFAAGNDGPGAQTVGAPGTAKNVITVGAAENVHSHSTANGGNNAAGTDGCGINDTGADSANDIIGFSSRGPCTDGRKKPEIVGPGTHVTGGVFQASGMLPVNGMADACFDAGSVCALPGSGTPGDPDNFFPLGQQWYTTSSGTSHSTPAVAGVAALARQRFINASLTPPSPAMTKATLMNSARYMNGVGANDTLWSNSQGMGEAHLNSFFDIFVTPSILKDQLGPDTFTASGQMRVVTGNVSDMTKPFRVTVAWTDAPGPTTGNAFVNNLDVEVTIGGNTYKGNVFNGAFSMTGGMADTRNNAESVFIPAGVSGPFVVKVIATNIAGDGVPNSGGALDQDYALVIYNAAEAAAAVIAPAGATITAESCMPANGAVDPGETVTVDFALQNIGTLNTTNLVATLQATGGVTSPSGPQNYGVVVAGGPAVSRPFTFTAMGMCGDMITATLQLQDGAMNLGTVTFTFTLGTLTSGSVTAVYSSGNIAVPIVDVGTTEVSISVSDVGVVSDINVRVRLNHTFDGDIDMFLVAPDGTTVELSTDNGGAGANYGSGANDCSGTKTIFDDSAASSITAGAAPFAGTFRPEQMLSTVNGKRSDGIWKLRIIDDFIGDVGTIGCVDLQISRQQFVCCGVAGTPDIDPNPPVTITAENCAPANNAVDPGETVTVEFPLINNGTGSTTNLVATLQATGGVTMPSGPQSYGVVAAAGPAVSRPFTFTASGMCGDMITATFSLDDMGGAGPLPDVTFMINLGAIATSNTMGSNATSIAIPGTGTSGPASPYPSTINIAGAMGVVSKVTVTLTNLSHTFPDDIDVVLVGPGGQNVLLMSDVGGITGITNVTVTFDDAAAMSIPDAGPMVSGTFMPSNAGGGDTFVAPGPVAPFGAALSVFNGTNPNGMWNLFVVDDVGGDTGNIAGGWSINIETMEFVCCVGGGGCTLTCPSNVTQPNDMNQCGAVVNYSAPMTAGSCGTVTCSPPSGSFFPVGTTTVSCTSSMGGGACSFTVTVNDAQAPTISCAPIMAVGIIGSPAGCTTVTFTNPTATDNCPGVTVVCTPPSGSCFPLGVTTVTCVATDAGGNMTSTASCPGGAGGIIVAVFDARLQDDSVPTRSVLFNTTTGDYTYCCSGGPTLMGKATKITVKGGEIQLEDTTPGRRVLIKLSKATFRGSASVTIGGGPQCGIEDRDTRNDTAMCAPAP